MLQAKSARDILSSMLILLPWLLRLQLYRDQNKKTALRRMKLNQVLALELSTTDTLYLMACLS